MWSIFWSIYKRMARKTRFRIFWIFSPDYIYNKRANKNESGMYARDIMKILHNHGTLPDISFQNSDMDDIMAANFKIKGYAQVETIEECKKALYMNGPCLISFPMYNKDSVRMWDPKEGDEKSGHHNGDSGI